MSAPVYTNITFPFTPVPALMAPYVSHDNPTGWDRSDLLVLVCRHNMPSWGERCFFRPEVFIGQPSTFPWKICRVDVSTSSSMLLALR